MPTPTTYIESLKDAAASFDGVTAPSTGQYYSHVYSQDDPATGVPTLGVTLYESDTRESQSSNNTISTPVQLNNLTDMQILEMVQSGQQVGQTRPARNMQVIPQQSGIPATTATIHNEGIAAATEQSETSTLPFGGIFILVLLLFFVGFVYFLIRIWQDHQAQKLVMTRIRTKTPTAKEEVATKTEVLTVAEPAKEAVTRKEFTELKNKISDMKTDISGVKMEMGGMKTEMSGMKTDIMQLTANLAQTERNLYNEMADTHKDLAERLDNHDGFTKEIDHVLGRVVVLEKHLGFESV